MANFNVSETSNVGTGALSVFNQHDNHYLILEISWVITTPLFMSLSIVTIIIITSDMQNMVWGEPERERVQNGI